MSEVEKMYENAGIEPERQDCCKIADKYWAYDTESGFEYLMQKECPHNQECTDECEYAYDKVVYPPFTAEKQIELIKWLSTKELKIRTNKQPYAVFVGVLGNDNTCFYGCEGLYLEQTLTELINCLWQELTKAEQNEIREILKG